MNKSTRFPPLNALRFMPQNDTLTAGINTWAFDRGFFYEQVKKFFQTPVDYNQKVEGTDKIVVYFDSLAFERNVYILDEFGKRVFTVEAGIIYDFMQANNFDPSFNEQYNTHVLRFTMNDLSLPDGNYYVQVECLYGASGSTLFISECIEFRAEGWDDTILFKYYHDYNKFGVQWEQEVFAPWEIRCEGFMDTDPTSKDVVFENFNYVVEQLDSEPYRVVTLIVGGERGIPAWMCDKINRVFSCYFFSIEDVQLKKEPDAKWSWKKVDDYALRAGTIILRDNPENDPWAFDNLNDQDREHTDEFNQEFN